MRILTPPATAFAVVIAVAGAGLGLRAQTAETASAMLEAAIERQWVGGDLAGAVRQYELILVRFGNERPVAAQALWRLGQVQEQLGRADEARRSYQRLVREYADHTALVEAADGRLAALTQQTDDGRPELTAPVEVVLPLLPPERQQGGSGSNQGKVVFSDLAVYDPRTGETQRLVTQARSAAYPVLSPGGNRVAYLSWDGDLSEYFSPYGRRRSEYSGGNAAELRVIDIGGTRDRVVVSDPSIRWVRPYEWSADGRAILALFERKSGLRQLALVEVDIGSVRVLQELPQLSAEDMGLSADGRFAAYQVVTPRGAMLREFVVLPVVGQPQRGSGLRYSLPLAGQGGARLSQDDLVVHVLNRIGFGPRPGDIERVRASGIDAYIEQQLHPERIADPFVDAKIANFRALRMEIPELLEKSGPPVSIAGRRRATLFERPAMVARAEAAATAPGTELARRASGEPRIERAPDRPNDLESHTARMIRAVHSERQLHEVMVDFWMNHFNINLGDDQLIPSFEEQVIRQHALGRFETLLSAVAHHPKMLVYLDNWRSSAPAEVIEARLAEARRSADIDGQLALLERMAFLRETKGLNENFARELLELHTMGVDSGYTQQDIIEVAKILTGWTVGSRGFVNAREDDGVFAFDPIMHVDGDKVVLGQTFPSGGLDEGEALLRMLASRQETARFISTKLARRFVADDPPEAVIEVASRAFQRTGGDIREVVRAILMSPEFRSNDAVQSKIKKPFELVASSLRAVNARFDQLFAYTALITGNRSTISRMGEKMYNYEAPDGNPDVGAAWMNSNALLLRLEFANALATNAIRGVTSDLAAAEALLAQMGVPKPTADQIEQHRAMLEAAEASIPAMGGTQMMMAGTAAGSADRRPIDPTAVTVAAMLGSPQFQKR